MSMPQWRASNSSPLTVLAASAHLDPSSSCWTCGQVHRAAEPHAYDYTNDVDEDLTCQICLQPLVAPTDTRCGHTFCRSCLSSHLRLQPLCPVDRTPLSPADCQPASLMVRRLLDKLEVRCPNSLVCSCILPRSDLEDHLNHRCHGAFLPCPRTSHGCQFQGARRSVQKHLASCPFGSSNDFASVPILEGVICSISIHRVSPSLGISVVGGSDSPLRCIIIQEINPDGVLGQDGRLQPGDQLVEINGQDLTNCTHEKAVGYLRNCTSTMLHLGVYRDVIEPQHGSVGQRDIFSVQLERKSGKHLGIKLMEKRRETGVFISELMEGGIAAQDGKLHPDDHILEINSQDVRKAHLEEATFLIQQSGSVIELLVSRLIAPALMSQPGNVSPSSQLSGHPPGSPTPPLPPKSSHLSVMPSVATGHEAMDVTRHSRKPSRGSIERSLQPKYFTINKGTNETLGIRVAGGLESNHGNTPVYVQNIAPQGCLGRSRLLKKGDVLISVNGTSLLGITHAEAVLALKATVGTAAVTLGIIEGPETSTGLEPFVPTWIFWHKLPRSLHMSRTVTLMRNTNESLGFSLVGGKDSRHSNEAFHILLVVQDSVAAKAGKLKCGDQILSVNGHRLDGLRHSDAVTLLKQARNKVYLETLSWPGTAL